MGIFSEVEEMFRGVSYNKFTSAQVHSAMTRKVESVLLKIEERQRRIEKIVADNGITPEALSDLVVQYMQDQKRGNHGKMSYSVSVSQARTPGADVKETLVPAGVIANLSVEKELISNEGAEVKRMQLILRNLKDTQPFVNAETGHLEQRPVVHTLDDVDIEYLGF